MPVWTNGKNFMSDADAPLEASPEEIAVGEFNPISFDVPLIIQPTPVSCWAASLAMVVSFRDSAMYAVEDIASEAGMDVFSGYKWAQIQNAVSKWSLKQEGSECAPPSFWAGLLRTFGPLWVVEIGAPTHAVVVTGMQGDGTPENTTVVINNPAPANAGGAQQKSFLDFENEFELGVRANAMIVHR
jgi:ABC-type bacteriocin/lantibiotic exporter with double-glycine peptidase domain